MSLDTKLYKFSQGDVYFWLEQDSSIMLKSITKHGDPVELTATEAHAIGTALLTLAAELEKDNAA